MTEPEAIKNETKAPGNPVGFGGATGDAYERPELTKEGELQSLNFSTHNGKTVERTDPGRVQDRAGAVRE